MICDSRVKLSMLITGHRKSGTTMLINQQVCFQGVKNKVSYSDLVIAAANVLLLDKPANILDTASPAKSLIA